MGALLMACALAGRVEQAEEVRSGVIPLIDGMSDEDLAIRLDAMGCLSAAEMYLDHFPEAAEHAEQGASHRPRHRPGGVRPHPRARCSGPARGFSATSTAASRSSRSRSRSRGSAATICGGLGPAEPLLRAGGPG